MALGEQQNSVGGTNLGGKLDGAQAKHLQS
jgi:hypothetical protein